MADNNVQNQTSSKFSRFLWKQPELLTPEEHGSLGITPVETPLSFASESRGIPLTMVEFRSAQHDYPIVFSDDKDPIPLAAVGLSEPRNLFIDASGHWAADVYVPAYLRAHPFALARVEADRYAVVLDRAAPMVSESPKTPFFVDGELTETIRNAVDFSRGYEAEFERTREFCARLRELDLLSAQRMRQQGSEKDLVRYFAVDTEKFNALSAETLASLFKDGYLAAIFAHLFSLDQWHRLLRRDTLS
jgi:hypothetical protein